MSLKNPPSEALERFVASVEAPLTAANREEYDLDALRGAAADEREAVVDALAGKLLAGDGRAAGALAAVGSARAKLALTQALASSLPAMAGVACARALAQLGDMSGGKDLIAVLRDGDAYDRKYAVNALQLIKTRDAEAALLAALEDEDAGVRGNAFGALVVAKGLKPYDGSYRDRIGLTYPLLGSPLRAVRAIAIADVRELLIRIDAGVDPSTLELAPVDDSQGAPGRWMESIRSHEAPFARDLALDALDGMHGRERRWAEDMMLGYLQLDPRASRAAGHTGEARFVEPLREVMTRYAGRLQLEAAAAVWRIAKDEAARATLEKIANGADAALAADARQALARQ